MNLFDFYIPEEILVALSLLVLVFVMAKIFWKPLMKTIDGRQAYVDGMLQSAEEAQKAVDDMELQRAEHGAQLERRAAQVMKEARELANWEHGRIIAEAHENARMIVQAGEDRASRAYEQCMAESREAIVALALAAAAKIVESSVDTDTNREFIEAVLQTSGAGHG